MRGVQSFQGAMFSYISLEDRVSAQHPLRKLRALVDALLGQHERRVRSRVCAHETGRE